jgi:hypothetical protein
MDFTWKAILWDQFGAAIDMLENALRACPDELWQGRLYHEPVNPDFAAFWYIGYHTLFWLDYYLSESFEDFTPPSPFTLSELDPAGLLPDRVYIKVELLKYLAHGRDKCRARFEISDLTVLIPIRPDWPPKSVAELLLYNMRHVQEHAAQLSLFLGQKVGSAPGWVSKARR